jgi:hypothetical protein
MKKKLLIRFDDSNVYKSYKEIDVTKIKDPMVFPNDVFFTIDKVRVAIRRKDWDEIKVELEKKELQ